MSRKEICAGGKEGEERRRITAEEVIIADEGKV